MGLTCAGCSCTCTEDCVRPATVVQCGIGCKFVTIVVPSAFKAVTLAKVFKFKPPTVEAAAVTVTLDTTLEVVDVEEIVVLVAVI